MQVIALHEEHHLTKSCPHEPRVACQKRRRRPKVVIFLIKVQENAASNYYYSKLNIKQQCNMPASTLLSDKSNEHLHTGIELDKMFCQSKRLRC